ncbi:MAG: TonB-dependent receptor, partial [Gammaproteobacteria bacterium]|nr:TonB-dependent receptor [Gammaproteobacteria bacterium]
ELYRLQRSQSVAELGDERLSSAELGWRFTMGRAPALAGSVALYRARKTDVILRDTNGFNVSGGRTRHEGLEYELDWPVFAGLRVRTSGTWAHHRYDFSRVIEGGETIVAGRDIDTAPRSIHRLAVELRPQTGLAIEIEARRTGAYFTDAANQRRHPAQVALRLNARWQVADEIGLNLEIENPTDQRLADRADYAQGDWRYFPARGRSVYFGVDWRRR